MMNDEFMRQLSAFYFPLFALAVLWSRDHTNPPFVAKLEYQKVRKTQSPATKAAKARQENPAVLRGLGWEWLDIEMINADSYRRTHWLFLG
jgi:hypothetical protein